MRHVDPNKLPIVLSRKARMDLACASHHEWQANFCRHRALHKLRMGDRIGHRGWMHNAIHEWVQAKRYYREARTNG